MISFITSPASATYSLSKNSCSIALQMVLKFHLRESSMVKLFIKTIRNTLHLHFTNWEY